MPELKRLSSYPLGSKIEYPVPGSHYYKILAHASTGMIVVEAFTREGNRAVNIRTLNPSDNVMEFRERTSKFRNIYADTYGNLHNSKNTCDEGKANERLGVLEYIYEDGRVVDSHYHKD